MTHLRPARAHFPEAPGCAYSRDVDDKRRDVRYPARIIASVFRRGDGVELLTNDVSFRGAFVRTDTPPALRQLVKVSFELPSGAIVSGHAMVVRVVAPKLITEVPGAGLQFYGPIDEAKAWQEFIYDLKVRERAGVPSARATDRVRRTSERVKLVIEVVLDGGKTGMTRDLSYTGMAVRTDLALEVGTKLPIQMRAKGHPPIVVDVVVRRKIDETDFRGVGVEFVDVPDETRTSIVAFVKAHSPREEDAIFVYPNDPKLH